MQSIFLIKREWHVCDLTLSANCIHTAQWHSAQAVIDKDLEENILRLIMVRICETSVFSFILFFVFFYILELSWFPFTTRKEILQYISKYFGVEETFKRVVMSSCIFTTAIFPLESELVNTCSVISSCRALTLSLHSKWVHVTLRGESRGKQDLAAELGLGGAES